MAKPTGSSLGTDEGPSSVRRHRLPISEKLKLLKELERTGESSADFCRRHGRTISPSQISRWRQKYSQLKETRRTAKSLAPGSKSQLEPIEKELLDYILALRDRKAFVTLKLIDAKVVELRPELGDNRADNRHRMICRFIERHGYTYKRGSIVAKHGATSYKKRSKNVREPAMARADRPSGTAV